MPESRQRVPWLKGLELRGTKKTGIGTMGQQKTADLGIVGLDGLIEQCPAVFIGIEARAGSEAFPLAFSTYASGCRAYLLPE